MKTVILCNRPELLKRVLDKVSGPLRYLRLAETAEARRVCALAETRPDSIELPRARLFRQRGESFRDQYLALMGRLNERNRSRSWWAMPFTDKHALARTYFRDASCFLLIVELIQETDGSLMVITDSSDLVAQVQDWGKQERVPVLDLVKHPRTWKDILKRYTPAAVVAAILRTALLWLLSRRYRPAPNMKDEHLVITTLTHPRSFTHDGYQDAYFGPLVNEVSASGSIVLIAALVLGRPLEQLRSIRRLDHCPPIVPLESFLTFGDLLACSWRALAAYAWPMRPQGDTQVDGLNLGPLVDVAVRRTVRSGTYLMSLRVYYATRRMAQRIRVTRCIYPYENRSLEKMLLLAIRGESPETRMIGYQHASVTPSHINFTMWDGEARVTPIPDMVLTTGKVPQKWLQGQGGYPPGMFRATCALRQGISTSHEPKPRASQLTNVLVALANNVDEYVRTLTLLERAFASGTYYNVRIRPHPTTPLKSALAVAPLACRDFYSESTGTLAEDLDWADMVLYSSSTVGLEAVLMGIPTVYLDLGNFLHTDPMFDWDEFKWSAAEPEDLQDALQKIQAIPEATYRKLQKAARAYASSYLTPVTPVGLRTFWEA